MEKSKILDAAGAAIENVPKLITGDITPRTLFNRYQLTLQAFGMDKVRAKVYRPGAPLESTGADGGYRANEEASPVEEARYTKKIEKKNVVDYVMNTGSRDKSLYSPLGTLVFCDLKLRIEGDEEYLKLIWVLTDVTLPVNIVKTKVQGRNGTVKEYISQDDYQVKIRGAIANSFDSAYPKDEVAKLIRLCTKGAQLEVVSEYLQMFSIHTLVVESAVFKQSEGKVNLQTFEISCVSDEPLLLKQKK